MAIDLIGSGDKTVALVEMKRFSKKKMEEAVRKIRIHNKNVKSVLRKVSGTKGKFRLRKNQLIWGSKDTEVLHKEYGYVLKLDPREVYFSPRESTIRQYVTEKVKAGENVLVMFAGIGPYAISIARKQDVNQIVAIEVNPEAAKYMRENVKINKVADIVIPIEGDVRDVCENLEGKFDRIIMPMVKAKNYLDLAAKVAKRNGTIQIYMVTNEREKSKDIKKEVSAAMKKAKKRYAIKDTRKISLYAPHKWKVLVEVKLK